ncbi:glycosyltransferase family 9 protein [Synechococcus sp.]|nr:MAG: hypothetical protein BTM30_08235 [Synechococcus lacustris str. Tous]
MEFLAFAKQQCAQQQAASAEQHLLAQFQRQPQPPSADFGLALALCNLHLDRLDQAQACLDRVLLDHGDSVELLQLALACERRRNEGSCSPALRQRLQAFLADQTIALEWLQLLQANLDLNAVINWAQHLLSEWPQHPAVLHALRNLAWDLHDSSLMAQLPAPSSLLWQGRCQLLQGDYQAAESSLRSCLMPGSLPPDEQLQALHSLIFQLLPAQVESLLEPHLPQLAACPNWAWTFGRALLAAGAWRQGWQLYEQRYYSLDRAQIIPPGLPLLGLERLQSQMAIKGSAVLLYGEQGIGDTLMFASMLPDLEADLNGSAGSLQLLLPPRLVPLMGACFPHLPVAASYPDSLLPSLDVACSIGSLGLLYRPDQSSFAGRKPHLNLPAELVEPWRQRLADLGPGLKIGIAWQGGGTLANRMQRSLALEQLLPILQQPGCHWLNLQYSHNPAELAAIEQNHGIKVHHFAGTGSDLLATAGLTAALDLVITVQQTALHIAAGLGVPTWGLLPYRAEWRYGLSGPHMAWYQSVRLFRLQQRGNWAGLIETVAQRLAQQNGPIPSSFDGNCS